MANLGSSTLWVRRRVRRFVVVGLFAAVALVAAGCGGGGSTGPSPRAAITDFNPGETTINASFAALNTLARTHTDQLRAVALGKLNDSSPNVHYAAVYALSLTAQSGQGSAEARPDAHCHRHDGPAVGRRFVGVDRRLVSHSGLDRGAQLGRRVGL